MELLLCAKHCCRCWGCSKAKGNSPPGAPPHPLQRSSFCLTHVILCLCRSSGNVGIYGILWSSWHAFPWSKRTGSWLFLCRGGREGLCFSVCWSKAHSCYMRTPWKCNLSSPRHRPGLTLCLRPLTEHWGLSLAEHLSQGQILTQGSAKGNNKIKNINEIKAGRRFINQQTALCRDVMEKISRKKYRVTQGWKRDHFMIKL